MNNAGMTGALALIGAGLFANAFIGNPQTVQAVPASAAVVVQGDVEPTIVWYGVTHNTRFDTNISASCGQPQCVRSREYTVLARAWSDGTVELKKISTGSEYGADTFAQSWTVVASPTEGLNAAADITFDEVVDGQDLAVLLARWGDAPRNPMPPSDCPLGLLN